MIMVRKNYSCLCSSRLYDMLFIVILIFIKVCWGDGIILRWDDIILCF